MLNMKYLTTVFCFILMVSGVASARTLNVGNGAEFQTIQSAIDDAKAGDVIEVAAGVYQESLIITQSQIQIVGSGPEQTTIESNRIVVTFSDISSGRFSGFTIKANGNAMRPAIMLSNATALLSDNTISGSSTAGIDLLNGANGMIVNNRIVNNQGIGVLIQQHASAALFDNVIEQNGLASRRAGVEIRSSGSATLRYNRLWFNGGSGVFVHQSAEAELIGNSIVGSGLHGVSINTSAHADLWSNTIMLNAQVGVRVKNAASANLHGNVIANQEVGLLSDTQLDISATDNVFFQNQLDSLGRGLSMEDANLSNNILLHPQTGTLFGLLFQLNEAKQTFSEASTSEAHQTLIEFSQAIEHIFVEIFHSEGLDQFAQTRFTLAMSL